ncbi:MAG: hypothetical protein LBP92_01115 [Deltaproteobacteria bacterium]|jgi:hypothetical protein|nr:hypothetical protein [Deltaproteobacteria bacterium]
MMTGGFGSVTGYMRIGGTVHGGGIASWNRAGHGLSIRNDTQELLKASKAGGGEAERKKIVQNFESAIAGRVDSDGRSDKTREERAALVAAVTGAVDRIRDDFGQETATEAMAEILKGTEHVFNAATVAMSLGKVLKDRAQMVAKISVGKLTVEEVPEFERMFGVLDKDTDMFAWLRETQGKLAGMVDFLNGAGDTEAVEDALATILGTPVLTAAASLADGSLAGVLNGYYGQAIIADEDRYQFTVNFEWHKSLDADRVNQAHLESLYGLDFRLSAGEIGGEALSDLARFLREELDDADGAALIEGLGADADVIAAVNSLLKAHDPGPSNTLAGPLKRGPDGAPLMANDDPDYWNEMNRLREAEYARLTDPGYEVPQFDYDSDYGYGFIGGNDFKWNDYQADLACFLGGAFLDRVNEVVKDDPEVRERFLKLASRNFGMMESVVPGDYGFIAFPTISNMGQVSAARVMGTVGSTAQERALERLRAMTYPEDFGYVVNVPKGGGIDNRTNVEEIELPGFSELSAAERVSVYEQAVARYEAEKALKGLLLEETV